MPLVNDIGTEVGQAIIKNVVANKDFRDYIRANTGGLSTVGLTVKLGLRFARTFHKARTDGVASFDFAGIGKQLCVYSCRFVVPYGLKSITLYQLRTICAIVGCWCCLVKSIWRSNGCVRPKYYNYLS